MRLKWTKELEARLIELCEAGFTRDEVAEKLGTTAESVGSKSRDLRKAGAVFKFARREYPLRVNRDCIDDKIIELVNSGKNKAEISIEIGLCYTAIVDRVKKLKRFGLLPEDATGRKSVSNEDLNGKILDLVKAGHGPTDIAEGLGLRVNQVEGRIRRMRERGEIPLRPANYRSLASFKSARTTALRRKAAKPTEVKGYYPYTGRNSPAIKKKPDKPSSIHALGHREYSEALYEMLREAVANTAKMPSQN